MKIMSNPGIKIESLPILKKPILIAGFDGWGNALNVSKGMVTYLIQNLEAKAFARIDPDVYYQFDASRPWVRINDGGLENFKPPGGSFYTATPPAGKQDLIILRADEPNLKWHGFTEELLTLCAQLGVDTLVTLGSIYDIVLHTDRVLSCVASHGDLAEIIAQKDINPISYEGPAGIHSIIHAESQKKGLRCISLWSHCPYYLKGTIHFGILAYLGEVLGNLCGFEMDVAELEESWGSLSQQIRELIEKKPDLKEAVDELERSKARGAWTSLQKSLKPGSKVINIQDFLKNK